MMFALRQKMETGLVLYNAEDGYPTQTNSSYTILHYTLGEIAYYPSSDYPLSPSTFVGTIPTSGQVDFQVRAMIGYRDRGTYSNGIMPYVFKGEYSDWSNTQTLTIPSTSHAPSTLPTATPSPTPSLSPSDSPTQQPTPTQTVESFPIPLVIAVVVVVVIATIVLVVLILAGLLVYIKKHRKVES